MRLHPPSMQLLRPSRGWLTSLLALAMLAVAAPANAAMANPAPTDKVRCANGKTAKTWVKFVSGGRSVSRLAADNPCKGEMTIAWWEVADRRAVGVWVQPGQHVDLSKSDFGSLPVKSVDGRVRLITYPVSAVNDAFRRDPRNRPFWYNGFVRGDTVDCTAGKKAC